MLVNFKEIAFSNLSLKFVGAILFVLAGGLFLIYGIDRSSASISKHANLAVRAVGHNLLLQVGDSTSVVPPVIEKSKGVFLLEFRHEFGLEPDSLLVTAQRVLGKTTLSNYTVTVQQCNWEHIVYGFEIRAPGYVNISCQGRSLPQDCYNIEIAFADFPDAATVTSKATLLLGGILSLVGIVLIGGNLGKKKATQRPEQNEPVQQDSDAMYIGRFVFLPANQMLSIDNQTISLTDKECKVLTLLSRNIGNLTLREELIQEVWTDEGVITGRSLDMFISKLRKKLTADPDLRITNVHGKGYRLEHVKEES